jgi:hypothetical protein
MKLMRLSVVFIAVFLVNGLNKSFAQASVVPGSVSIASPSSFRYTPGAGNNRLLVVAISQEFTDLARTVTSITWGGQSLTSAAGLKATNGGNGLDDLRGEIWYLDEANINQATGGCNTFVVTWSSGPTAQAFTVLTLKDVDQVMPISDIQRSFPAANSTTVTCPALAVTANDIVFYATATQANATHSPPTGYTEQSDQAISATTALATATKQITAGTTETPGAATWTVSEQLLIIGVAFNGVATTPVVTPSPITYYSRNATLGGAWNANTSWTTNSDGSGGPLAVGTWPRRQDNVVILSGHMITLNNTGANKNCRVSPDGLLQSNIGSFISSNVAMFYHTGDISIKGSFVISTVEIMIGGYTHIETGGSFSPTSFLVNTGYLEVDAGATLTGFNSLVLTGNSTTIINNTPSSFSDDLIIDHTDATLCGSGSALLTNGSGSVVTYTNGATDAQICKTFIVNCSGVGCSGFPVVGTTNVLLGNIGPGGVGNSSNNKLWLKADALSQANNSAVTSWADASGNALTATNSVGASSQPTFLTNSVNTILPSLSFDGGDWLTLGTPASLNLVPQTDSWSTFFAFNVNNGNTGTFLSKATTATRQYQFTIDGTIPNRFAAFLGDVLNNTGAVATGTWTVGTGLVSASATGYNSFLNGTADLALANIGTTTTPTTDVLIGARRIDASTTTSAFNLTGSIGEIALYNSVVNVAQRIIIDNYLSAKYATTLAANDVYTMDNAGNGNYDFEVAGIGQVDAANKHLDGKGSGIVRMWNPNNLGNGEFLIWGRDNSSAISSTTAVGTAVDGTIIKERLTRIWRVSESGGDVGTVSISFNISGLGGSPFGSNLRLLIDRDADGFADNDVTPVSGSFSSNIIVFSGINFQDGDRFTLGNTNLATPLPVEFLTFKAKAQGTSVLLTWSTATEINNQDFTIERAQDAKTWTSIGVVKGGGNSTVQLDYQFIDEKPKQGLQYYRLRQTDFDGHVKYSQLVSIDIEKGESIAVFPNPSSKSFTLVSGNGKAVRQLRFIDALGRSLPVSLTEGDSESEINVDPGEIAQGVYFIQILTSEGIKSIRVVRK